MGQSLVWAASEDERDGTWTTLLMTHGYCMHEILRAQNENMHIRQRKRWGKEIGGTWTTVMAFWVRVPVLSLQMALAPGTKKRGNGK